MAGRVLPASYRSVDPSKAGADVDFSCNLLRRHGRTRADRDPRSCYGYLVERPLSSNGFSRACPRARARAGGACGRDHRHLRDLRTATGIVGAVVTLRAACVPRHAEGWLNVQFPPSHHAAAAWDPDSAIVLLIVTVQPRVCPWCTYAGAFLPGFMLADSTLLCLVLANGGPSGCRLRSAEARRVELPAEAKPLSAAAAIAFRLIALLRRRSLPTGGLPSC